jgi:two-component sensor histidine kinase
VLLFKRLGLHSVWSRLLGTMALVVVPAGVLIALLAYSLFEAALSNLETSQRTTAAGSAAAMRSWFDAAGRSLANEAFAAHYVDARRCSMLATAFLQRNRGFSAVRFFDETSTPCSAGAPIEAGDAPPDAGGIESGYGVSVYRNRLWIVAAGGENGPPSLLGVEREALQERLEGTPSAGDVRVILLGPGRAVMSGDSALARAPWLPTTFDRAGPASLWRCPDRSGAMASFALAPIGGSPLSVLMRFEDRSLHAARQRLAVLCLALMAMLALLAYVYAATIHRDIVVWIQGIDQAARSRGRDPESLARAPVGPDMPRELRSVAESFNAMADRAIERRHELISSLAENRALMLEMHHRIKNSLQVIQSYLALIRRAAPRNEALLLARIEARVGVLAIAYRLALTPGGMRPIPVRPFLEEICAAAVGGLRRPRQRVAYALAWDGELVVDRAIPLGLGLVEGLIAAFTALDASYVGVTLSADANSEVELRVESDAAPAETGLPDKVMRGLANQLGAAAAATAGGEILAWRFHA